MRLDDWRALARPLVLLSARRPVAPATLAVALMLLVGACR